MNYWLNNAATGKSLEVKSYDDIIELLDLFLGYNYEVIPDSRMTEEKGEPLANVWWVKIKSNEQIVMMFTSC